MSFELILLVIMLMGITSVALFAGESERNSVRTVGIAGIMIIGIAIIGSLAILNRPLIDLEFATQAALLALIIAAPLLDRARTISLLIAAPAISIFLLYYAMPYAAAEWGVKHTSILLLIGASIAGLFGSALLSMHRQRQFNITSALIGRIALAGAIGLMLWNHILFAKTALICGWICGTIAFYKGHAQPLRYVGMGIISGTVLAQAEDVSMMQVLLIACAGAYFTFAGEKIAKALVIDDAHNITGTILMPALFSLIVLGMSNNMLAESIEWLGAAIGVGLVASLGLFILRFTLGLSASDRLLSEGLDASRAP